MGVRILGVRALFCRMKAWGLGFRVWNLKTRQSLDALSPTTLLQAFVKCLHAVRVDPWLLIKDVYYGSLGN